MTVQLPPLAFAPGASAFSLQKRYQWFSNEIDHNQMFSSGRILRGCRSHCFRSATAVPLHMRTIVATGATICMGGSRNSPNLPNKSKTDIKNETVSHISHRVRIGMRCGGRFGMRPPSKDLSRMRRFEFAPAAQATTGVNKGPFSRCASGSRISS